MMKKKWKNKNFAVALKNSISGIKQVFRTERNFKIQLAFAMVAILMAILLKLTGIEWVILILVMGSVFFAEMLNTAIEVMLDLYIQEYNEGVKIAKDIASGAVLITAIVSVIVGAMLFLQKILKLIGE